MSDPHFRVCCPGNIARLKLVLVDRNIISLVKEVGGSRPHLFVWLKKQKIDFFLGSFATKLRHRLVAPIGSGPPGASLPLSSWSLPPGGSFRCCRAGFAPPWSVAPSVVVVAPSWRLVLVSPDRFCAWILVSIFHWYCCINGFSTV